VCNFSGIKKKQGKSHLPHVVMKELSGEDRSNDKRKGKSMIEQVWRRTERRFAFGVRFFDTTVSAGFPSPAEDTEELRLDLNDFLVKHPETTFFVRVQGESMTGAAIHSGDILIVDRSLQPWNEAIVVAVLDGEFTVKRMRLDGEKLSLVPENPKFQPLEITQDRSFQIWGVVTGVVRNFLTNRR
jgi:DNA polymerase V